MLTVKGLNKSFGENEILKKIDMKIEKGKVIAILGPSGSGKTTLLRCLNALEIPNRGELSFDDFSIDFSKSETGRYPEAAPEIRNGISGVSPVPAPHSS